MIYYMMTYIKKKFGVVEGLKLSAQVAVYFILLFPERMKKTKRILKETNFRHYYADDDDGIIIHVIF